MKSVSLAALKWSVWYLASGSFQDPSVGGIGKRKFGPLSSGPLHCKWFSTGPAAAFLEFVESVVPLDVSRNGMEISAKFYEMHLLVTR